MIPREKGSYPFFSSPAEKGVRPLFVDLVAGAR
jgi:hypothetical protein